MQFFYPTHKECTRPFYSVVIKFYELIKYRVEDIKVYNIFIVKMLCEQNAVIDVIKGFTR